MARRKLTEFKAKKILHNFLGLPYFGLQNSSAAKDFNKKYVVKVDQGIKGRMKKGLVKLNVSSAEVKNAVQELKDKGYSNVIIEEMVSYNPAQECFISMERERKGVVLHYSLSGGINIEEKAESVSQETLNEENILKINETLGLPTGFLEKLLSAFNEFHFSFLEINPLVVDTNIHILDLAVEVDDAAEFFVRGSWDRTDFVEGSLREKTEEEKNVQKLAEDSQASLKLDVFNPDGSIFLLLSGGGASIVLADEAYNLGFGREIANYGEYSGNPNDEETYTYTQNLLSLLLNSKAPKKVLIIAGGVANFTDIRKTFKGIIRAIEEKKVALKNQGVKVYVRRGGPFQKEGLAQMKEFLQSNQLYGSVSGPEMVLTDVVKEATQLLK